MRQFLHGFCLVLGACFLLAMGARAAEPGDALLEQGFSNPPGQTRLRMFWRVFGPAWQPADIDYQLRLLRDAGIGGITLFLMYPVAVDSTEVHNQHFLSREFLDTLSYAARRANELGIRFSLAGGTGWPFGGPSVSEHDAAKRLRQVPLTLPAPGEPIKLPDLPSGERLLAAFAGTNDITARLTHGPRAVKAGELPPGPVTLYLVGPTQMKVKRPALGAEGLVLDHYQSGAADRYLRAVVDPMLRAAPGLVDSVFCDSLEVYGANWTEDLPSVFARQRSYPLVAKLPVLFGTNWPGGAEVRFDFWRTLSELTESRFTKVASDWLHHRGVRFEMEAYGAPPNPLTAARFIDEPTGEQYEWKGFSLSRLASSGAHLAGKRVIGAEAWTWLGLPNRLGDSLSDLKLASDLHFLAGENDLVGVDFAYSPRSAGAPGWMPYYGPVFNQNNPQWPWFRDLAQYVSRCQWLLRQGRSVAPVAVYLPVEDIFAAGPVDQMLLDFHLRDYFVSGPKTGEFGLQTALRHESHLLHSLLMAGFNYDGIDFWSLDRLAEISKGQLLAGDGDYRILLLPGVRGIEFRALRRIVSFCQAGGTVLITDRLPERTYGGRGPSAIARSAALLRQLLGQTPDRTHSWARACGRGRVRFVPNEQAELAAILRDLKPDLRFDTPEPNVGFVHRQGHSREVYFLANLANQPCQFTADFSLGPDLAPRGVTDARCAAELWDPMSGHRFSLPATPVSGGCLRVPVALGPQGSAFVVFRHPPAAPPLPDLPQQTETPVLSWRLEFNGSDAPSPRSLTNLVSWTELADARFFSGLATYATSFTWDRPVPRRAWLVLSQVREVAEVRVNGRRAGDVWTAPFEVELTGLLVQGTNLLSITVANLPLNRFLGAPDEDLKTLRAAFGDRFPAPEERRAVSGPAPSGLIGPVRIRYSAN